jgi:hypothetical protein
MSSELFFNHEQFEINDEFEPFDHEIRRFTIFILCVFTGIVMIGLKVSKALRIMNLGPCAQEWTWKH